MGVFLKCFSPDIGSAVWLPENILLHKRREVIKCTGEKPNYSWNGEALVTIGRTHFQLGSQLPCCATKLSCGDKIVPLWWQRYISYNGATQRCHNMMFHDGKKTRWRCNSRRLNLPNQKQISFFCVIQGCDIVLQCQNQATEVTKLSTTTKSSCPYWKAHLPSGIQGIWAKSISTNISEMKCEYGHLGFGNFVGFLATQKKKNL